MSIKENQSEQETEVTSRDIPVNRIIPPELPLQYSDGLVVQQRGGMFTLSFFQAKPPIAFTLEEAANIEKVDSICVAQILLTPQQMEQNINAMASNYERFLKKASVKDEEPI